MKEYEIILFQLFKYGSLDIKVQLVTFLLLECRSKISAMSLLLIMVYLNKWIIILDKTDDMHNVVLRPVVWQL